MLHWEFKNNNRPFGASDGDQLKKAVFPTPSFNSFGGLIDYAHQIPRFGVIDLHTFRQFEALISCASLEIPKYVNYLSSS